MPAFVPNEERELLVEKGRITTVMLNRPEKCNALSPALIDELTQVLFQLDADREVVVIVLKGAGKGFCAGADLSSVVGGDRVTEERAQKARIGTLLKACTSIRPIILASVHGFALAGGFGLAMTADLTIVTDDCRLGMPEIKRGLVPMNIMCPLSRVIPNKRLFEHMATGTYISPKEAMDWGLVNRVVAPSDLEMETARLAALIASYSGAAQGMMKQAFYTMRDMESGKAYAYLSDMLTLNALTKDAEEGAAAFLGKRSPIWRDC